MKIMIDIPERLWSKQLTADDYIEIVNAVANGTPLRPNSNWTRRHYINGDKTLDMWVCSHCGEEFSYDAETGGKHL